MGSYRNGLGLVLIAVLAFTGCADKGENAAEELYKLSDTLANNREYNKAVEVLQFIRINYENSPYAANAEEFIPEYEKLQKMLLDNNQRVIHTRFSSIARALENYKVRFLAYPLTKTDLEKLPVLVIPEWDDVWGNQIYYAPLYSSENLPRHSPDGYALASFGMDGLPGGEGRNRDHFFKNGQVVPLVTE